MGATLRALRALVLLAGFYVFGLLLLAAIVGADVSIALMGLRGPALLKLYVLSVVLALPIVQGFLMLRTPEGEEPSGLEVSEADEPELWRTVRELAAAVETRAPSRIVLTGDVNAAVSERSRFLGLLPGPRALYLGVPLVQGLSEAQLRSVLAHEFGHYSHADTRLAGITVRGRAQVLRTVSRFEERAEKKASHERARLQEKSDRAVAKGKKPKEVDPGTAGVSYRVMAKVYGLYARFYFWATLAGARRQEFAADAAAARITGRDATVSALREIPGLSAAHDFYLDTYATLGLPADLLPPRGEVLGGFGRMLAARELELASMRAELPDETVSRYDSHPSMRERVRRVEALAPDDRTDERKGAASALLADPDGTLAALEDVVLVGKVRSLPRATGWQELLEASMEVRLRSVDSPVHRALAAYTEEPPTLTALLKVIEGGRLWKLARRLPLSEQASAAEGRVFREFARPALLGGVKAMVLTELSADSRLTWEFSWSESAAPHIVPLPDGTRPDVEAAVAAAVADIPETTALRALLTPVAVAPLPGETAAPAAPAPEAPDALDAPGSPDSDPVA
ncbi:M48 family metallopeptidase [Streptomyces sp. NBC_00247]|uniref:M48 family metallopeptidase n=1 Tax=Streptomyces sp. NBC_00247 TaxID=2975689 RepID=UPI002E2D7CE7|nr:M48 family metallopeptidase [Streptomyces sp. NBC_00247]